MHQMHSAKVQSPTQKADKAHLLPIASAATKAVDGVADVPSYSVGIVGAGVAGMFTALIFDHLNENFGLNVTYEIIEAVDEDNVGGRLYTYNFPNKDGQPPVGPHDYYDVGAMRFPDSMERYVPYNVHLRTEPDFISGRFNSSPTYLR
jgi:protoporphyrinogen oxidase